MSHGWLVHHEGALWLDDSGSLVRLDALGEVALAECDGLGFARGSAFGVLILPGRGVWVEGESWSALDLPVAAVEARRFLSPQPALGVLYLVWEGVLHAYRGRWEATPLPPGATWAIGSSRGPLALGAVPSDKVSGSPTEAAAWTLEEGTWRRLHVGLGFFQAMRVVRNGGLSEFLGGDATGEPLLLVSECYWFLDDPSGFAFVRDGKRFKVERFANRRIARALRASDGTPVVTTTDGELWRWQRGAWHPTGTAKRLGVRPGERASISGADQRLLAVVHSKDGNRALESVDGGVTWTSRTGSGVPLASWVA